MGALLGQPTAAGASDNVTPLRADEELQKLPIDLLQRGKYQPRIDMRQETRRSRGFHQGASCSRSSCDRFPKAVRVNRSYEIIAGRRYAALPVCTTRRRASCSDGAAIAMALIENIQRENLNGLEKPARSSGSSAN